VSELWSGRRWEGRPGRGGGCRLAQEWSSFRAPKGSVEDGGGMGVKAGKGHFGKEWLDGFGWDAPGPKKAPCELAGEKQRASEPEVECGAVWAVQGTHHKERNATDAEGRGLRMAMSAALSLIIVKEQHPNPNRDRVQADQNGEGNGSANRNK